jgi:hypothetical protein
MKKENQTATSEWEVSLRIVLIAPPSGVDYGVQQGKGNDYITIHTRRSTSADLAFEFTVTVKNNRDDGKPNFLGPRTHGPPTGRFLYINIGKSARQVNAAWDRRLKIPLDGIPWEMIEKASTKWVLEARLPGTGKDGGPSCATVKPIEGWKLCKR